MRLTLAALLRQAKRLRLLLTLLPVALGLLHATRLYTQPYFIEQDAMIYDARLRASMPGTLDPRIVIVDVDEKSLAQVGRWPWGRDKLARLTEEITQRQQAKVLGFDFVFAEPDEGLDAAELARLKDDITKPSQSTEEVASHLTRALESHHHDGKFVRALQDKPVVLGYYFTSDRDGRQSGRLPAPIAPAGDSEMTMNATLWNGYGANLDRFTDAAASGFFNAVISESGVVRSLPVLARYNEQVYESFVLSIWRTAFGPGSVGYQPRVVTGPGGDTPVLESLLMRSNDGQAKTTRWVLDEKGAVLVPYRGKGGPDGGSFEYVSAADVLHGRLAPGHLAGKIVLVGSTAPGLQDLRQTPLGPAYPGVEVHANLISSTLDGRHLFQPDYVTGYEAALIALLGLVMAFVMPRLEAGAALVFGLGLAGMAVAANAALFHFVGMALPLAATLDTIVLVLVANMVYGYFVEGRAKRSLAELFGVYIPPELVQEMLKRPSSYSMRASSKELTVLFCDLKGFTQIAESLAPSETQRLLNIVLDRLTTVIRSHNGTIDKYMGDCVMAFWGAPVEQADHAGMAVRAAIDMVAEVPRINAELASQHLPQVSLTIGLATGLMAVGDMGSKIRKSYTVIGDSVNLGARLQRLCDRYQVDIIACATTYERSPAMNWRYLDRVTVKGKALAVTIYTPGAHDQGENQIPANTNMSDQRPHPSKV